jgi:streptogramin lyase
MSTPALSGSGGTFKVHGSLVPTSNEVYNLGSPTNRWKDLFLSGNTIHLGTSSLSADPSTGGISFSNIIASSVDVEGAVTAAAFIGDGSLLTGMKPDVWSENSSSLYVTGSNVGIGTTNPQQALDVVGDVGVNGTLYMTGNVMPTANETYDLGAPDMRFRELYLSGNTIYLGSNQISVNEAGQVDVGNVFAENFIGNNLTATNITAGTVSIANLAVSGTLDAKLDTNTVQIGTTVAQIVNIGTSTLTQTINVGTGSGATIINIGGAGDTVNIAGTLTTVNTTNTTITDNRITLNKGGAAGSGGGAGFTVEEDESQVGHVKTTNNRESWELKAPATSGVVTVIPGTAGFEVSASNMWTASGSKVYRPSGGVGIGTVPVGALDVVGTVKATAFVGDGSLLTGIVGTGSGGVSGTSVWTSSSSNVYVVGSNVGVGTTNPQQKLHVVGNTVIEGNLTVDSLSFNVLAGTPTIMNTNVGVTDQLVITNDGTGPALIVNQTGTQPILEVQDDGVPVLKIIDGGNVGLGTTNPQQKLDVVGTVKATNFVGDGSLLTGIVSSGGSGTSVWSQSSTNVYVTGSNVGIGLTNPSSKLHVVGDTRIEGNLTVNGTQTIVNTNVGTTDQLLITNDGTGPAVIINQTGAQPVLDVQDDGVSVLKIVDGGNVGVGTTNPQAKLHVIGTVKATSFTGDGSLITKSAPYLPFTSTDNATAFKAWVQTTTISSSWWSLAPTPKYSTISGVASGGERYRGGVYLPDGRVLFVPHKSTTIGLFDPRSNTYSTIAIPGSVQGLMLGGVVVPDGRVIFIPHGGSVIGIFNPSNNSYTSTGTVATNWPYTGGVLAPNGKVVFVPGGQSFIGIFDPLTNTLSTSIDTGSGFSGGVLLPDGRICFVPGSVIGLFNPITNAYSTVAISAGAFSGGVLVPDGRVIFVPQNNSNIGIFNPANDTYTTLAAGTGSFAFSGGSLLPDGRVIFAPYKSTTFGIFNPANDSYTTISGAPGNDAYQGCVTIPDGRVVFVPQNALTVGILSGFPQVPIERCLHPCFNKF